MARFLMVMTGMLMLRRIAAQHLTAGLADPKMDPAAIDPNAFFTAKHRIVCFGNQIFRGQFIQVLAGHGFANGINDKKKATLRASSRLESGLRQGGLIPIS